MQFLYKAYACDEIGNGKFLLPGYAVGSEMKRIPPKSEIEVELADGTRLKTTIVDSKVMSFDETVFRRFPGKVQQAPFYQAIQVPDEFSAEGIGLGANIYLVESCES